MHYFTHILSQVDPSVIPRARYPARPVKAGRRRTLTLASWNPHIIEGVVNEKE